MLKYYQCQPEDQCKRQYFNSNSVLKCLLFMLMRLSICLNVKLIFFGKVKFFRLSQGIREVILISI